MLSESAQLEWVASFSGLMKPRTPVWAGGEGDDTPGQSSWDPLVVTSSDGHPIATFEGLAVSYDLDPTDAIAAIAATARSHRPNSN